MGGAGGPRLRLPARAADRQAGDLPARAARRHLHVTQRLLALALIALAYVGAELIGAWGFLAVFAAGLGLRHAEKDAAHESETPSEELIAHAVPHLVEGGLSPRELPLEGQKIAEPRSPPG